MIRVLCAVFLFSLGVSIGRALLHMYMYVHVQFRGTKSSHHVTMNSFQKVTNLVRYFQACYWIRFAKKFTEKCECEFDPVAENHQSTHIDKLLNYFDKFQRTVNQFMIQFQYNVTNLVSYFWACHRIKFTEKETLYFSRHAENFHWRSRLPTLTDLCPKLDAKFKRCLE